MGVGDPFLKTLWKQDGLQRQLKQRNTLLDAITLVPEASCSIKPASC